MKNCVGCGETIPYSVIVDGKRRNLQNRTKCLSCLPFGESRYRKKSPNEKRSEGAEKARRYYHRFKAKNGIDPIAVARLRRKAALVELFGGECQICGYSIAARNLTFHHINKNQKEHRLSSRELQYNFGRLLRELKKCVMVCHNCHGEIHDGLIDKNEIIIIHQSMQLKLNVLEGKMWSDLKS